MLAAAAVDERPRAACAWRSRLWSRRPSRGDRRRARSGRPAEHAVGRRAAFDREHGGVRHERRHGGVEVAERRRAVEVAAEQHRPEQHEGDHDVHAGSREDHDDPLPGRLAVVGAARRLGIEVLDLLRVHAGDLHVAARRDRADRVLGLAALDPEERRREEQREALDAHADGLRDREVPELVQDDQHDDARAASGPSSLPLVWQASSRRRSTPRWRVRAQRRDGLTRELARAAVGLVQRLE